MKRFFAILFLVPAVCVACEIRPTTSQTASNSSLPSPSPTQTTDAAVSDQGPCSLVMDQAPVINGLRLGMTKEEVLSLFPGSKDDAQVQAILARPKGPFGTSSFDLQPDKYESKDKISGISQVNVRLLDDRVSNLRVGYNGPEYSHVDKFLAKLTEGTDLPAADAWEPYVGFDNLKTLKCKDFEIQVFIGGKGGNLNYVDMRDLEAEKTLKERKDKAKQKATP